MVVHEPPWGAAGSSLAKEPYCLEFSGSLCCRRMSHLWHSGQRKVQIIDIPSASHGNHYFPWENG